MSDIDVRSSLAITYCKQQKKAWNIGHLDKKRMTCLEQLVSLTCASSEAYNVQHVFRPGGYSLIWAIQVRTAPKGMVVQPFWSEIGYKFRPFWSEIGYGLCTLVLNWVCFFQGCLTSVYRTPRHTDQYLSYDSHHPQSVKCGVVKSLYDRSKNIITKPSATSDQKEAFLKRGCLQSDNMTTDLNHSRPLRDHFLPLIMPTMLWIKTHQP